jgi:hypothetical protein
MAAVCAGRIFFFLRSEATAPVSISDTVVVPKAPPRMGKGKARASEQLLRFLLA